jgi:hypothetical protein
MRTRKGRPRPRIAAIEARWGRPIAGVLTELYVIRGLSIRQTARVLQISRERVNQLMREYGIPRRRWAYPASPMDDAQKEASHVLLDR